MKILVVGGTGLVGTEVLKLLSQRVDAKTLALVRRWPDAQDAMSNVSFRLFDFDRADAFGELSKEKFDVVFCCLGTTRKKAGSADAFVKVDLQYPKQLIDAVKATSPLFCLVSSVGADKPVGLYLETKHALENLVIQSGMRYVIVRPSLLLGHRQEFRLGEKLAAAIMSPLQSFFREKFGARMAHYSPVQAAEVAEILVRYATSFPQNERGIILQGRDIFGTEKIRDA